MGMDGVVRGAVVNGGIIVWLMTRHGLRGAFLVDQRTVPGGRGRSICRGGLDGLGVLGDKTGIDRGDEPAHSQGSSTPISEE